MAKEEMLSSASSLAPAPVGRKLPPYTYFRDIPSVSLAVVFPSRPRGTPSDSLEPLGPLEAWGHMPDPTKQGCRALSVLIEGHMQQWKVARQMWVQM